MNSPESLGDLFEQVYLINLAEREDRLVSTRRELKRIGSTLGERGVQIHQARKFSDAGNFPNVGSRGAFHSHWECINRAIAVHARDVLILEDDIGFTSSLPRLFPDLSNWMKSTNWDIVYFGHLQTGPIPDAKKNITFKEIKFEEWRQDVQGLHFYAVKDRILSRVSEHLEMVSKGSKGDQEYGPMPVDGALNIFRRHNQDVRTFIVSPKLGWQLSSKSDITPKIFDHLAVLGPVLTVARRIKRGFKSRRG